MQQAFSMRMRGRAVGGAAISVLQTADSTNNTATFGSPIVAGQLIVLVYARGLGLTTIPSGFTAGPTSVLGTETIAMAYKVAGGSETGTYSWGSGGSNRQQVGFVLSAGSYTDQNSTNSAAASTSIDAGASPISVASGGVIFSALRAVPSPGTFVSELDNSITPGGSYMHVSYSEDAGGISGDFCSWSISRDVLSMIFGIDP